MNIGLERGYFRCPAVSDHHLSFEFIANDSW